jgi:hypothetical protein
MAASPGKPISPTGQLSVTQLQKIAKQAAQANRVTADNPVKVVTGPAGTHISIDTTYEPFLARLTSSVAGTGSQTGLTLYGFIEQQLDGSTGIPSDFTTGRQDNLSGAANTYALEWENQSVTVPGSTPSGFTNAGPYVEMQLRQIVNGAPVYGFAAPAGGVEADWLPGSTNATNNGTIVADPAMGRFVCDENGVIDLAWLNINRVVSTCLYTSGSAALTSISAQFTAGDVGKGVIGRGIPSGTTISSFSSSTSVTMNNAATATALGGGSGVQLLILNAASTHTGVLQLIVNAASDLQWGVWTNTTQQLGGNKTLLGTFRIADNSSGIPGGNQVTMNWGATGTPSTVTAWPNFGVRATDTTGGGTGGGLYFIGKSNVGNPPSYMTPNLFDPTWVVFLRGGCAPADGYWAYDTGSASWLHGVTGTGGGGDTFTDGICTTLGGGGGGGIAVGSTTITGGSSGSVLYDSGGVVGEISGGVTGSF